MFPASDPPSSFILRRAYELLVVGNGYVFVGEAV